MFDSCFLFRISSFYCVAWGNHNPLLQSRGPADPSVVLQFRRQLRMPARKRGGEKHGFACPVFVYWNVAHGQQNCAKLGHSWSARGLPRRLSIRYEGSLWLPRNCSKERERSSPSQTFWASLQSAASAASRSLFELAPFGTLCHSLKGSFWSWNCIVCVRETLFQFFCPGGDSLSPQSDPGRLQVKELTGRLTCALLPARCVVALCWPAC